jgi:hypothetical protein
MVFPYFYAGDPTTWSRLIISAIYGITRNEDASLRVDAQISRKTATYTYFIVCLKRKF